MVDALGADIRYTFRTLRRQPGFVTVTAFTLALGIGANTAVFSVLNGVILRPLPYAEPEQLVRLYNGWEGNLDARQYMSGLDLVELRESVSAFSSVGIMYTYRETGADLTMGDAPQRLRVLQVSSDYFRTWGATPLQGRTFRREEETGDAGLVIVSHRLWQNILGSDPSVLGRTIELDGRVTTIVGVMRPGFRDVVAGDVDAWVPQNLQAGGGNSRGNHYLTAVARLAPGASLTQARDQIAALEARWRETAAEEYETQFLRTYPLAADVVGDTSRTLLILMGAAGLVLLIACVNVANLFLVRSVSRQKEIAIRSAMGAARRRLVRQQLVESLLVAAVGAAAGSIVAFWGVRFLLATSPGSLARAEEVGFDPALLAFGIVMTGLTVVLVGLVPALHAARVDPNTALRDGTRGNTSGGGQKARGVMVTTQVALALVLLVGAGILLRSFGALLDVDLGIDTARVATFEVNLPNVRYASGEDRARFHHQFLERIRSRPGVEAAGAVSWLPGNGPYHIWGYSPLPDAAERGRAQAQTRVIEGDYFSTMGIPLLAGRTFDTRDRLDTEPVALISRALAAEVYGDGDPLGGRFRTAGDEFTVIGVVGDAAHDTRGATMGTIYLSHAQYANNRNWSLTYVVRSTGSATASVARIRTELAALDNALVLYRQRTMEDVLGGHRARARFTLLLMTVFACIALSLAAIGVYGVLSYTVNQRAQEMGIRLALGARAAQVRGIVVRRAAAVAGIGLVIGLIGAWLLSRFLESVVFGVSVRDPIVFIGVAVLLTCVVLAAAWMPARRATRMSPVDALRS